MKLTPRHAPESREQESCVRLLSSREAWDWLAQDANAVLIDVRTPEEWRSVGMPDLSKLGRSTFPLSWKLSPDYRLNPDFIAQMGALPISKETPVLFICRSGGRSQEAAQAALQAGYEECYNLLDGFEGSLHGVGWKNEGLPWRLA